ncbi:hypothetical protein GCM10009839_16480 [Catenulispora yoronensis]|uniref:Uncharacterized protein n=1 Tax=Catenulispora yoronensis TaxID=450799 RepID=A0ABP5FAQ5_9ACTN
MYFAAQGREASMDAARQIAKLTHGDPAAWEGTAILHELVRLALDGEDPIGALPEVIGLIDPDFRVPARWVRDLHVPMPGWGDRVLRYEDLVEMAERLPR